MVWLDTENRQRLLAASHTCRDRNELMVWLEMENKQRLLAASHTCSDKGNPKP